MTIEDPQAFTREDFIYFFLRGEGKGTGEEHYGALFSLTVIEERSNCGIKNNS